PGSAFPQPLSLSSAGYCKVDETPKGWFVQYIDRDPETIRRQLELDKKKKHDEDDEERAARFIEDQVRRGKHSKPEEESSLYTELKRDSEEPVTFSLKSLPSTSVGSVPGQKHILSTSALEAVGKKRKEILSGQSEANEKIKKKKTSALDEIMEMEETKKKAQRNDFWLYPGIVVKVTTNRLGEKYFKKKAVVKEVNDKYTAIIKMLNSGDKLRVDQIHVQTVIPVPGKKVLILNGGYLGCEAVLQSVDEKSFSAMLCIDSGPLKGRVVSGVAYEDFSKLL
uniref:Kin17 DNA and RNA binding protein n=1 Tax=Eptatretus burgeri TaxID=7764 RepID=A0A8C4Q9N8_EPTBU